MSKQIELTNSTLKATVDDEDFDFINQFRWYLAPDGKAYTDEMGLKPVEMGYLVLKYADSVLN